MSRLEDLLQTLCPEGVEYQTLGEIADVSSNGVDKKIIDGQKQVMLLNYMDVYRNKLIDRSVLNMKVTASDNKIITCDIQKGDIFITPTSETIEDLAHSAVVTETINGAVYSYHVMRYRLKNFSMTTSYYLSYLFRSNYLQEQILKNATGLTRFGLSRDKWKSLKIPLPPLPVQEEIVRILDTFSGVVTELEQKLEAEQAARVRQYEHYREELLGLEVSNVLKSEQIDTTKRGRNNKSTDSVLMRIDELCHIQRGRVMSKDYLRDNAGIFPVYSSQTENQGVFGYINSFDFDFESLTWTTDGANAGSIFYHNQEKFSITNVCGLLRVKSPKINTKFLYYALQNTAKEYVNYGMGNPKLMSNVMGRVKIIVPPLAVQEKIVSILDRFDALVNDLKSGLPAEIALRRKQYEYYRDQLLTFKPLE